MTGVERLRELANGVFGNVWNHTLDDYCEAHGLDVENQGAKFRDELNNIANQIECEQMKVIREYEDISGKDSDALAWVEAHGGLEAVKQQRRESVPREVYERKRIALLGHIAECETALGRRRDAIARLASENDALLFERSQMRQRLMPEGMEWPVFEDGEPVMLGDESTFNDEAMKVEGVELTSFGYILHGSYRNGSMRCATGEERGLPAKRPAPKVLDADGVEIHVGDTVYNEVGTAFKVIEISEKHNAFNAMRHFDGQECIGLNPAVFTHRAPVLAADGKPLREGETVWSTDSGTRYTVEKVTDELIPIKCCSEMGSTVSLHPSQLTHERLDSWERLEEDATKLSPYYYARDVMGLDTDKMPPKESRRVDMMRDLVRRAKKLAGVSE